jgi:hypothetical protein
MAGRIARGRIARGEARLYQFAPFGQKSGRPSCSPATVPPRTYPQSQLRRHLHNSRRAIGSHSERGRRHEIPVRGEPAQRGYSVATRPPTCSCIMQIEKQT